MAAWLPQEASDVTPITDDHAIREALADLTGGQPPMPPGRFAGVRQRAIRHRRRQVASVISSVLALAGLVAGLSRLPASTGPLARPSWALQWPDLRNGSVPQSVLDDAVAAWLYSTPYEDGAPFDWSAAAVTRIVRLFQPVWYVGQTIDHGQEVAVIFEVSGPMGRRLVVGYASASDVMPGHAAWPASTTPWAMNSRPVPRPHGQGSVPEVSEYVPMQSASGNSVDNWIVVLTSPAAQGLRWYGPIFASGRGAHSNSTGLVVANLGQLRGDVMLEIPGSPGEDIPVGIPGAPDVPVLTPPALTVPASFNELEGFSTQGNEQNLDSSFAPSHHAFAIIATCYNAPQTQGVPAPSPGGTGPLRVSVNGHALPPVGCTSGQQMLLVPHSYLQSHNLAIQMTSSDLTAWQVAFGAIGRQRR